MSDRAFKRMANSLPKFLKDGGSATSMCQIIEMHHNQSQDCMEGYVDIL